MVKKSAMFLFSIYGFVVFTVVMLLLFPFFVFASFLGPIRGGNMIYAICRVWADIVFFFWGVVHTNIYEAPKATDHPVVFVFNHISYADVPILIKTFRRQPIRVLGKAEMSDIPIFGFIYKRAVIPVKRDSAGARLQSVRDIKKMLNRNIPVVVAPEGTFNTTHHALKNFYDGAFRVAIQSRVPIQPVLLLDGYDRLKYYSVFTLSPGKSRSVFLPEISTEGLTSADIQILKEKVFSVMSDKLHDYKATWIDER